MEQCPDVDLNALRSFLAVVTHGGFAAASRKLRAPKSTLSRHVRELEEQLDVRLLERSTRGFRLTPEGEALHARAHAALAELDEAERELTDRDPTPRGPLRVAITHAFAQLHAGALFARFVQRHPEVLLEAVIAETIGDLVSEGFDVAITVDPPDRTDLVVRKLRAEELLMVASPKLIASREAAPPGEPWPAVVPARLQSQERFAAASASRTWKLTRSGKRFEVTARAVLRLPSKVAIRDAVIAGAGAALLPTSLVEAPLREGQLVQLGALADRHALCIVHSSLRLVSARVRAFVDFVVAELG